MFSCRIMTNEKCIPFLQTFLGKAEIYWSLSEPGHVETMIFIRAGSKQGLKILDLEIKNETSPESVKKIVMLAIFFRKKVRTEPGP